MDNRHRSLYVTDDDRDRVFKDKAGKDGLFGTRDDVAVTVLHTRRFGSFDPEGLTWLPQKKMLIVSDSTTRRICKIRRGKDRRSARAMMSSGASRSIATDSRPRRTSLLPDSPITS